jgi:hypothetical protein
MMRTSPAVSGGNPPWQFPSVETSPQGYARLGGALYLVVIAFGFFAEGVVANKLIVSGDAAATAHNIMASPMLGFITYYSGR